jgi:hypothetical protein
MYQLCRALSAIPVDHKKLSDILHRVADFRQPKVLPLLRLDVFSSCDSSCVGGKTLLLAFPSNVMMVMWFKEPFVWFL